MTYSPQDSASTTAIVICWKSLLAGTRFRRKVGVNRPIPSSKTPHFQNEAKCTTFLVKVSFICMRMKNRFHIKGWALNLVLIQKPRGDSNMACSLPQTTPWAIQHNYGPSLMRNFKFANYQTHTGTIIKGVNIIKTAMLTIYFARLSGSHVSWHLSLVLRCFCNTS